MITNTEAVLQRRVDEVLEKMMVSSYYDSLLVEKYKKFSFALACVNQAVEEVKDHYWNQQIKKEVKQND